MSSSSSDEQGQMISTMREILQEEYIELGMRSYTVQEDLIGASCHISCELEPFGAAGQGGKMVVEGDGVGTIDALFNALRTTLSADYASLNTIEFSVFEIRGLINAEVAIKSKAEAEATVGILNSEEREFTFRAKAPSVSHAGIMATLKAAEYFINSERTFVKLHNILEHYRSEGRSDLVQKYTTLMAEVVKNTSYSEVVDRIRREALRG